MTALNGRYPNAGKPYQQHDIDTILEHAGKLSAEQIGELIGRSGTSVIQKAFMLRIPLGRSGQYHPKIKHPDEIVRQAVALFEQDGLTIAQISKQLGIHRTTITQWVYGINRDMYGVVE